MNRLSPKSPAGGRITLPPSVMVRFAGLSAPVIFRNARPVQEGLARVTRGWQPTPVPATAQGRVSALSEVSGAGGHYSVASPFLDEPLADLPVASATCALIADLAQGYSADRPDHLSLHCGAVRIDGRLVAFTGPARAGKSTLIARLAFEPGMAVFCDDVLPVDPQGHGVALGCAPRLRLPLPDGVSDAFRAGVKGALALRDDRYGYVVTESLAAHGQTAPLGAVVLLSREPGAPARLSRLDRARAMQTMLLQNMADMADIGTEVARIDALTRDLTCLRLVYSDLEEAVALIRRAFSGEVWPAPDCAVADDDPAPDAPPPAAAPPADLDRLWQRVPGPVLRRMGDEGFLWHPDFRGYRLNPTAIALWSVLEEPVRGTEIVGALAEAFPDTDPARIAADVARQLGAWVADELILPVSG
ncbi:PqqD family peptide modification chaperone [Aliigemmobacter aestuarii]|uniref:PqqD family peptide modification chaperone n=1 Tax=Aliigemmobacter aestuarii TaxID=1445661 RepID=A0A4S3MQE4_9RHOB|nr:PqqD family protein [Gemmobacter aestuarii]THD84750.1 PqqD family peptide modification chaperone [Gemmobacter aestuarii]